MALRIPIWALPETAAPPRPVSGASAQSPKRPPTPTFTAGCRAKMEAVRIIRRIYTAGISPGRRPDCIGPLFDSRGAAPAFLHPHAPTMSPSRYPLFNLWKITRFSSFVGNRQCIRRIVITQSEIVRIMGISESGVVPRIESSSSRRK